MLKKILIDLKKYRFWLICAVVCTVIGTGISLAAPAVVRELINMLGDFSDRASFVRKVTILGVVLTAAYILRALSGFVMRFFSHKAAYTYIADLRGKMYSHLQELSLSYYQDKQTGQLVSRIISDTATLEVLIAHVIPDFITNVIIFVGVTAIVFSINWTLALITCIPIPFIIMFSIFLAFKIRPNFRKAQQKLGVLSADLTDNFSGMKEIQLFNGQAKESASIDKTAHGHATAVLQALFKSAIFHPSIEFFSALGTVLVIVAGGILAINGRLPTADIVAFLLYLAMFYAPITTFTRLVEDYQSAMAGGERIFEILSHIPDIKDCEGAKQLENCKGEITFEDVAFGYHEGQHVLNGVSLTVPQGKMLAVVGPSGAGKSTLVGLIPRFFDSQSGRVLIDGTDVKDVTLKSLRDNVSMVLQDVFLFNGTVAENIAYAAPNSPMDKIIEAARLAGIHDDIESMPEGYETHIGERGVRLSGGQKQRLSIARAILRDTPILILDEATASVDVETENRIKDAINGIAGTRTLVVIAHRLSTVRKADIIIALEHGVIAEQGTHEELLAKKGVYYRYYTAQA